jgi:hypothetical protein
LGVFIYFSIFRDLLMGSAILHGRRLFDGPILGISSRFSGFWGFLGGFARNAIFDADFGDLSMDFLDVGWARCGRNYKEEKFRKGDIWPR